jgi:thimet oligopeptidase
VQLFQVTDAKTGKLIGHFYLDLFPRPNKYGHAAAWTLRKGEVLQNGKWQTPISAMVCNFTKPTATDPSLLSHDEVETYFHEFGHVMHNMCTESKIGYFSGTSVYQDFVEAPSQMLENWVWNADVLASLSGNYKDHSQKLPKDLLDRMIAAKNVDNGLKYSRQAFFAKTDMRYHMEPVTSTTDVWHQGMKDVFGIAAAEGTHEEGLVRPPVRLRSGLLLVPVVGGVRGGHVLALPEGRRDEPGNGSRLSARTFSRKAARSSRWTC